MTASANLQGGVIDVVSPWTLLINVGERDGVVRGMKFEVRDSDQEIYSNGELVGRIERVKVRVEVTEVYQKFSLCRTYLRRGRDHGATASGSIYDTLLTSSVRLLQPFTASGSPRPLVTLRSDDLPYQRLDLEGSYIERHDRVVRFDGAEGEYVRIIEVSPEDSHEQESTPELAPQPGSSAETHSESYQEDQKLATSDDEVVDKQALDEYISAPDEP